MDDGNKAFVERGWLKFLVKIIDDQPLFLKAHIFFDRLVVLPRVNAGDALLWGHHKKERHERGAVLLGQINPERSLFLSVINPVNDDIVAAIEQQRCLRDAFVS